MPIGNKIIKAWNGDRYMNYETPCMYMYIVTVHQHRYKTGIVVYFLVVSKTQYCLY